MKIPKSLQSVISSGDKAGFIANKIEECHRAAKALFGNEFEQKTKPIRVALQALIEKGCNTAGAGLMLLKLLKKKGDLDAMGIMLVCAVIYDMELQND